MSVDLSDLINSVMRKLAELQRTFLTQGNQDEHTREFEKADGYLNRRTDLYKSTIKSTWKSMFISYDMNN